MEDNERLSVDLHAHPNFSEAAKKFYEKYELVDSIFPGEKKFDTPKQKKNRECRFCGKINGATKFNSKAHLIPEALGNQSIFSAFECDTCNHFFGVNYDSELSNFLGVSRTINRTKNKGKIPIFKSPKGEIEARPLTIADKKSIVISRTDAENGLIDFDKESNQIRVKFKRPKFVPRMVYLSFLKVALSIIEKSEFLSDYKLTLNLLMGKGPKILTGLVMRWHVLKNVTGIAEPYIFLFKKRRATAALHTHVMCVYYENFIFSLPIPLNLRDKFCFDNSTVEIPLYPPFFIQKDLNNVIIESHFEDFYSPEKTEGGLDEITIIIDPEFLGESAAYDSERDLIERKKFNPSEIMSIILGTPDSIDNPKSYYEEFLNKRSK